MADKRKKDPSRKLSRIHESRGTCLDIDEDRAPVYKHYKRVVGVSLPEQFFTAPASWKVRDKEYFFNHFMATYHVRRTTKAEREIPFEVAKLLSHPVPDPDSLERPFFKFVMVCNMMPGCRLKVSVDDLRRKPEDIVILAGLQVTPFAAAAPMFQPLSDYLERVEVCWSAALRMHADEIERYSP